MTKLETALEIVGRMPVRTATPGPEVMKIALELRDFARANCWLGPLIGQTAIGEKASLTPEFVAHLSK